MQRCSDADRGLIPFVYIPDVRCLATSAARFARFYSGCRPHLALANATIGRVTFSPDSRRRLLSGRLLTGLSGAFGVAGSMGHRNTARSLSAGVSKSMVFRGRWFSFRATALSWLCEIRERSAPRGKYWRRRPLVFPLLPRCQGLRGSQK